MEELSPFEFSLFCYGDQQDVVKAKPAEHELLFEFEEVVERGGHSTYMLIMEASKAVVRSYWRLLENLGCSYESGHIDLSIGRREIFSVDVPPSADIYEVYEMLEVRTTKYGCFKRDMRTFRKRSSDVSILATVLGGRMLVRELMTCGRGEPEARLAAGARAFICDSCVSTLNETFATKPM